MITCPYHSSDQQSLALISSPCPLQWSGVYFMPVWHVVAFYILRGSKDVKFSWYCSLFMILIPWNVFLSFKPRPLRTAVQGSHFKGSSVQFASLADKASSTQSPAPPAHSKKQEGIQAEQIEKRIYMKFFARSLRLVGFKVKLPRRDRGKCLQSYLKTSTC